MSKHKRHIERREVDWNLRVHTNAMLDSAQNGDMSTLLASLPLSNPRAFESVALVHAAERGDVAMVRVLMDVCDPKAHNSRAFVQACAKGHLEVAQLLYAVSTPKTARFALVEAAWGGHVDVVEWLLGFVHANPRANASRALQKAVQGGHWGCVEMLLPLSNPRADSSRVLQVASAAGRADMVERLMEVCAPEEALGAMTRQKVVEEQVQALRAAIEKRNLQQAVGPHMGAVRKARM